MTTTIQLGHRFMHPSGEKITLGCYFPSSSTNRYSDSTTITTSSTTTDTNSTTAYYNSNLPLTLFSISIDPNLLLRSTPSPEEAAEDLSNCSNSDTDSTTSSSQLSPIYKSYKSTPFWKRYRLQEKDIIYHIPQRGESSFEKTSTIFNKLQNLHGNDYHQGSGPLSQPSGNLEFSQPTYIKEEPQEVKFVPNTSSSPTCHPCFEDLKTTFKSDQEDRKTPLSRSETVTQGPKCMPCGHSIMNEGEEKDFWNKEKVNNDEPRSASVPGDGGSQGSGSSTSSTRSIHTSISSDHSDDSPSTSNQQGTHNHPINSINISCNSKDTQHHHQLSSSPTSRVGGGGPIANTVGADGDSISFLGPIGKKRKYCRERQKSGDTEQESRSPFSLPPPTPTGGESLSEDRDPASMDQDLYSPDPSEENFGVDEGQGQGQGSSSSPSSFPSRNIFRVGSSGGKGEKSQCVGVITSTPTPVIRSVPSNRRREDQPLNLSLPSPVEPQQQYSSTVVRSPNSSRGKKSESSSVHVSVISLAAPSTSREREEEALSNDLSNFQDISSPSLSFHSNRSPRDSNGELTPGTSSRLSPQAPSTSSSIIRDFHPISPGDLALSPGAPSNFQGLLLTRGIISPSSGPSSGSAQKKKLQCVDCGKEFSQLRNYRYHRSRHEGTQQFACTCPVCGKTFNDKGYLSSHLKIHRNAKEYKCEWCEKSFNQRVAYNMHVRIHTGHKPHKCDMCSKAFSRKMLLRQHLRTHTGERPYKCEICQKAFADRSNMLLHQRLHSGQRPYKCTICQKSFSKNHHLKTHLNHHAGVKPYQCQKCMARFSQSSNMKTHYRKCSGIPNATSTITSGTFQGSSIMDSPPTPSATNIPNSHSLPSPSYLQRYMEDDRDREQQQYQQQQLLIQAQQDQLHQQLTVSQQQQLLREVSQINLRVSQQAAGNSGLLLQSPSRSSHHRSSSSLSINQTGSPPSLGLNMGILNLASPPLRSRRSVGNTGVSLGSPSPTSLAAGHPYIPLATVESLGATNNSGSTTPTMHQNPAALLLSPHHHSTLNDLNTSAFSQLNHFPQSTNHQRLVPRSRLNHQQQQQQQYISQMSQHQQIHADAISESRVHHHLSSQQHNQRMPTPRASPQRQLISPHRAQSPEDHYEIVLPALAVSRTMLPTSQQFQIQHENFAQQSRSHGPAESHLNYSQLQHQHHGHGSRIGINGNLLNSTHVNNLGSLLSVSRASSTGVQSVISAEEGYMDSPPSYSEQDDIPHSASSMWRHRDSDDVKFSVKNGQFKNSNV